MLLSVQRSQRRTKERRKEQEQSHFVCVVGLDHTVSVLVCPNLNINPTQILPCSPWDNRVGCCCVAGMRALMSVRASYFFYYYFNFCTVCSCLKYFYLFPKKKALHLFLSSPTTRLHPYNNLIPSLINSWPSTLLSACKFGSRTCTLSLQSSIHW